MPKPKSSSRKTVKRSVMRAEYDFSGGVKGKYAKNFTSGANLVVLAPDLTEAFPTSESVNEALRALVRIAKRAGNR